jgi:hypothetical protein
MLRLREFAAVASVAMLGMTAALGVQKFGGLPRLLAALPTTNANAQTAQTYRAVAHMVPVQRIALQSGAPRATPVVIPVPVKPPVVAQIPVSTDDVADHVRGIVPRELAGYFDLYLYVSKAAHGSWAQHMFVFDRTGDGDLKFEQSFPVSTGREMQEKYFTSTPAGLFELDPDRFDRRHYSHRWHNAPMPWAMFLNYTIHGNPTGVALHSAIGHEAELGHRASGGCVRMPPEKAEEFFERIQRTEAGDVPVFAMDGSTTDKQGQIALNADGSPMLARGYRVLLIIEDYPGAPVLVATIS